MLRRSVFSKTVEVTDGLFVTASARKDGICAISVKTGEKTGAVGSPQKIPPEISSHINRAFSAISAYFEGENRPLYKWSGKASAKSEICLVLPAVSDFRLKVWEETSKIPYGKTLTYSELAREICGENHRRAVAGALAANVFPILIPCHRVIGAKGMCGYGGGGVEVKKNLLAMESGAGD